MPYSIRPDRTVIVVTALLTAFVLLTGLTGCVDRDAELPEPQVIVENGAWTWFNDERAIVAAGRLFVGYVDTAGFSSATVVRLEDEGAQQHQHHRLGSFLEVDDHNNAAFVELEDGRVLAVFAPHHTQPYWYWRRAEVAGDSVVWSSERRTEDLGAMATYSNLFRLEEEDGRIYNFFRATNFDPTFMTSDDGGETWSPPQHFIVSGDGDTRPYVKYASNQMGRIDLVYTQAHPRDADNDVYHVYYDDGYLYRSDGTRIQPLPGTGGAGPMQVDAGTKIYDADTSGRAWVWDLEYAGDGTLITTYIAARDSTVGNDLRYRYARWDDDAREWREQEIAYAGTRLYDGENHYAGGIALDPADPSTLYTSSDVHPATGDTTEHYQLYRGATSDGGATWSWTTLTPDAIQDNIRPFVPRGGRRVVLWLRGRYTAYQDYDTDIMGVIQ